MLRRGIELVVFAILFWCPMDMSLFLEGLTRFDTAIFIHSCFLFTICTRQFSFDEHHFLSTSSDLHFEVFSWRDPSHSPRDYDKCFLLGEALALYCGLRQEFSRNETNGCKKQHKVWSKTRNKNTKLSVVVRDTDDNSLPCYPWSIVSSYLDVILSWLIPFPSHTLLPMMYKTRYLPATQTYHYPVSVSVLSDCTLFSFLLRSERELNVRVFDDLF